MFNSKKIFGYTPYEVYPKNLIIYKKRKLY